MSKFINEKKGDNFLKNKRQAVKLDRSLASEEERLSFEEKMKNNKGLVITFSYRLSLNMKRYKKSSSVIVMFNKPINKQKLEEIIRNGFKKSFKKSLQKKEKRS